MGTLPPVKKFAVDDPMATAYSRGAARLMISPAVLLLLGWTLILLSMTIWFSFQRCNLPMPRMEHFTGFDNYEYVLTDCAFFQALTNTLALVLRVLFITIIGGTLLAPLVG
jgi:sorbitol/mannitol transport system permease protein